MNGLITVVGMAVGGGLGWVAGMGWMMAWGDMDSTAGGLIPIVVGTVGGIVVGGVVAAEVFT